MDKNVFDFLDYKAYLRASIRAKPKGGRGVRVAMATTLGCPVSHISQVIGGNSQLSMEQAEGINEFLGHTPAEADFFLLLLQFARAGSVALRRRLRTQIDLILEKRLILKDRLGIDPKLSIENQTTFYSSWIYGAIHVMLSIEKFHDANSIARHLGISIKRTNEVLEFLTTVGLAEQLRPGHFKIGTSRIHLGNESPLISKFHTNWRMKAVEAFNRDDFRDNLHYSSAVTISEADFNRIKGAIIEFIEEIKSTVRDSKEEIPGCFAIDFFRI